MTDPYSELVSTSSSSEQEALANNLELLFVMCHHKHWKIHYFHPVFTSQLSFFPPPAYQPQLPSVNAFFFLVSKGKRAFTRHDLPGYPHTSTLRGESHSNLHKLDLRCRHPYFVTPPQWQHSPACALCYLLLSRAGLFCDSLMNPQLFCRPSFPLDQWDRAAHRGFIWEGELPHAKHQKHMTSVRDWELPL